MKPTAAQLEYLRNAKGSEDDFFFLNDPGTASVGRRCLRRKWIRKGGLVGVFALVPWYMITPAGLAVLAESEKKA